jgi:hypothetical protein
VSAISCFRSFGPQWERGTEFEFEFEDEYDLRNERSIWEKGIIENLEAQLVGL